MSERESVPQSPPLRMSPERERLIDLEWGEGYDQYEPSGTNQAHAAVVELLAELRALRTERGEFPTLLFDRLEKADDETDRLHEELDALRTQLETARQDVEDLSEYREEVERTSKALGEGPYASISQHARALRLENDTVRLTLRPRVERLLIECGFSTPAILRILDPLFGEGPSDHGQENAPKKHVDCVAIMCGKVDCRRTGPCYVASVLLPSPSSPASTPQPTQENNS